MKELKPDEIKEIKQLLFYLEVEFETFGLALSHQIQKVKPILEAIVKQGAK